MLRLDKTIDFQVFTHYFISFFFVKKRDKCLFFKNIQSKSPLVIRKHRKEYGKILQMQMFTAYKCSFRLSCNWY